MHFVYYGPEVLFSVLHNQLNAIKISITIVKIILKYMLKINA